MSNGHVQARGETIEERHGNCLQAFREMLWGEKEEDHVNHRKRVGSHKLRNIHGNCLE